MAIELHTLTAATLDAADAVLVAAYGGTSRRARLANYLRLQPGGWVLAEFDGAVAGVAGATNYGPFAYIGLVGVSPAYQRRGVALAMMHYLLCRSCATNPPPCRRTPPLCAASRRRICLPWPHSTRPFSARIAARC
jgi:GNAT superfamily N-acetyltransferase